MLPLELPAIPGQRRQQAELVQAGRAQFHGDGAHFLDRFLERRHDGFRRLAAGAVGLVLRAAAFHVDLDGAQRLGEPLVQLGGDALSFRLFAFEHLRREDLQGGGPLPDGLLLGFDDGPGAAHDEEQGRIQEREDGADPGQKHEDGALVLAHQVVHVRVDLEHAGHRLGRAGAHGDVGLHEVVFFRGAVEAVEAVAVYQLAGDLAADGGDESRVAALVVADLGGLGGEGDDAVAVVDFDAGHRGIFHQVRDGLGDGRRQGRGEHLPRACVGHRVQVVHKGGAHRVERGLGQGEVVLRHQVRDAPDRDLPVEHGEQRAGDEDADETGDRVEAQQLEHHASRWAAPREACAPLGGSERM